MTEIASGNPHNQLAVLAVYTNLEYKCVLHYFQGLLIESPFATIKENLVLQFQKNKNKHNEIVKEMAPLEESEDRTLSLFLLNFIRLQGVLFTLEEWDSLFI